ncbi:peptide chain release factor N(5)-glutamine methyltransferase [Candidatus Cytomitobacter indipagum]|uniref:Peptide chain release factor N(5)-glutamine methyltransferase n=1 Tax=Candidatus Cytomitobacter indipagum TaxID=2601575 RepID=A0A5C0UDR7_9PROT|nr:HemK/PrmC family methyltransferase [Candidatus Cytomitobacter indipagum]QEK38186.1 peptide chain release factor N(5)-glutamine methyltransferase [Candidatus Cytomitobacter indipagum]
MLQKYSLNDIWHLASNYFEEDKMQKSWHAIVNFLDKNHTDAWINKNNELPEIEVKKYMFLLDKLKYGMPMYRAKKCKYFWKDEFFISPYTLEPRPETECIIETAISFKDIFSKKIENSKESNPLCILDVGTGTGCILLSLLKEFPNSYGVGVDISEFVLNTARYNAEKLNIDRCAFTLDLYSRNQESRIPEKFDLIVSNPPYVCEEIDHATKFDPISAVFCDDPTVILQNMPLKNEGILLCEVPIYLKEKYEERFKKNYKWHKTSHPNIIIFEYINYLI